MRVRLSLLFLAAASLAAQSGGSYSQLEPEQQRLVRRWVEEFRKLTGRPMQPETEYGILNSSARTTFEAVTHALLRQKLTAKDGTAIGTAIDLVDLVEAANGKVAGVRGDHQFRIYVLLRPDALKKLYASQEFKRTGDNTVFHIGYPLNFRLQGGTPSIQFSITRTGRRADIDVDYRSSSGAKALFNGHLTAANSDVRAGQNFVVHTGRWSGLLDWWHSLLSSGESSTLDPKELARIEEQAETMKTPEKIDDAVHDFYKTWLADKQPREAVRYFSVNSYSCLAEFADGSTVDKPLARLRILMFMMRALSAAGNMQRLTDAVKPVGLEAPEAKPFANTHASEFTLDLLRDDVAYEMDFRQRLHVDLAYRIERPEPKYSDFYASVNSIPAVGGGKDIVTLLWGKEEGRWRIVSWHLDHPFKAPATIQLAAIHTEPAGQTETADAGLSSAVDGFLSTWLVRQDSASALTSFAPESLECGPPAGAHGADRKALQDWLANVAKESGTGKSLGDHIATVKAGHSHLRLQKHRASGNYLLAKMSDELAGTHSCTAIAKNQEVAQGSTGGVPHFTKDAELNAFNFRTAKGHAGVLNLLWMPRDGGWKIASFYISTQ